MLEPESSDWRRNEAVRNLQFSVVCGISGCLKDNLSPPSSPYWELIIPIEGRFYVIHAIKLHIKPWCSDNDDDDDNGDGKGSATKRSLGGVNGLFTRPSNGGIFGVVISAFVYL